MKLRTHGCVALGTSGHWQGSKKCFDLKTGKVVTLRIVKELPYPDRVTKRVNEWGKTSRGEKYSDSLEFLNRKRQPFDWENKELNETLPEVEEPIYPDILAEVPGLVLESDLEDDNDAVMTPPPPTIEEHAEAALGNSDMTAEPSDNRPSTGVHGKITGVDNVSIHVTPTTTPETHDVQGITPPRLIRPQVEVEDVESDDEDEGEER